MLFEQLTRPANFYFVIVAILQVLPMISTSGGKPTILVPLVFVLTVSGVKEALEDYKRHTADVAENTRLFERIASKPDGSVASEMVQCMDLRVGDFVKVKDDEPFPSDLLLIYSGSEDGAFCYVETANLDGETNLKIKMCPEATKAIHEEKHMPFVNLALRSETPNEKIDSFAGELSVAGVVRSGTHSHIQAHCSALQSSLQRTLCSAAS
jgi:P-type E1-E2 ATPase